MIESAFFDTNIFLSVSHWDSTVIAAAHASGCATLFSEDLQHGFKLDHLTIINPFL